MDEKSLYAHILNLSAPWQVKFLSLDENAGSVTVVVGIAKNTQLVCPTCGQPCPVHDHRHRKWRHLDACQFMTIVEANVPRVMCPNHGCQTLPVPWAGPGSRYTLLFESFVLSWLKISTVDAVRKQLKLSWNAQLTSQCWVLKELAKDIWNRPWSDKRRADWQQWIALARSCDVPVMRNMVGTITKRLYGILNAMRYSVSNGNAEALNSKIRLLRIKARGYRNRERFKLGVMFHYGKLDMAF